MYNTALLTDYYQISTAYAYWQAGKHEQTAVFHLFFRRNPIREQYVIAAGLTAVMDYLTQFAFTQSDIDYLSQLPNIHFSSAFLDYLKTLRFTGQIDAVKEGSVVFANEPILRIQAPLIVCQLLETPLINLMNFASTVATMASRMRVIAKEDALLEFGLRRAQGPNGGLTASRSAFLAGFDGTSNVLAGKIFGIPVLGTMGHSWVMTHENELSAFSEYAKYGSNNIVLLVDTYHTATGIDHAIAVGKTLEKEGKTLAGIRLDSGDLALLTRMARDKLNAAGFHHTKIYVSGDLTEERMTALKSAHAPIDGWGVGTHLTTSYEQPTLDMVYKLSAIETNGSWQYKLKRSENLQKTSDPGILQVQRVMENNQWKKDVIYDIHTHPATETDLLVPIFRDGICIYAMPSLVATRDYCLSQVRAFLQTKPNDYCVERDAALVQLKEKVMRGI